jgi:hypothetical protein
VNTSISDSDITALIALSDAEISDRGLTGLSASALQEISMLLTAEKIVLLLKGELVQRKLTKVCLSLLEQMIQTGKHR